jgi:hypothetical protein
MRVTQRGRSARAACDLSDVIMLISAWRKSIEALRPAFPGPQRINGSLRRPMDRGASGESTMPVVPPHERLVELNDLIQIVIRVYRGSNSSCDVRCHRLEVIWVL